jgi:hypothetical protein
MFAKKAKTKNLVCLALLLAMLYTFSASISGAWNTERFDIAAADFEGAQIDVSAGAVNSQDDIELVAGKKGSALGRLSYSVGKGSARFLYEVELRVSSDDPDVNIDELLEDIYLLGADGERVGADKGGDVFFESEYEAAGGEEYFAKRYCGYWADGDSAIAYKVAADAAKAEPSEPAEPAEDRPFSVEVSFRACQATLGAARDFLGKETAVAADGEGILPSPPPGSTYAWHTLTLEPVKFSGKIIEKAQRRISPAPLPTAPGQNDGGQQAQDPGTEPPDPAQHDTGQDSSDSTAQPTAPTQPSTGQTDSPSGGTGVAGEAGDAPAAGASQSHALPASPGVSTESEAQQ